MSLLQRLFPDAGVRVPHHKDTANYPTEQLPLPKKIVLTMSQHVGAPCEPLVKRGDTVYVGTMIGRAPSAISMHIFSSVSGTVKSVEPILYQAGRPETVVVIEPDGLQTPDPSIQPPEIHDMGDFISALRMSGIVGLGGAGFPTDIKASPKNLADIDTILINGAECEPYLTTDNREFLECPDFVLSGVHACLDHLGVGRALLCIEDNKPAAIDLMTRKTANDPRVSVHVLQSVYPQGAEKVLIKNATGRIVPRGGLPAAVGVIVMNVTTVSSIGKFLKTGMPLTTKRLTVNGDAIANHKNIEVPIGTPIADILEYCGTKEEPQKILVGGPMMGRAQMDINYPITRQNNGLLAFGAAAAQRPVTTACIRCGRCVNSCPANLSPVEIRDAYLRYDAKALDDLMADLCVACGTCSYVCPAKRPLTQTIALAKTFLQNNKNRGKS